MVLIIGRITAAVTMIMLDINYDNNEMEIMTAITTIIIKCE